MDQPTNTPVRASAIPRLSGIPISRGSEKSTSRTESIRFIPQSRIAPKTILRHTFDPPKSADAEPKVTVPTSSANITSTNDLRQGGQQADGIPEAAPLKVRTLPKRPRPSLSDRTIETLSQIPPSPSPRRRKSGFLPPESPSRLSSRPGSSLNFSRPGTSHDHHPSLPLNSSSRPGSPTKRQLAPTTGNQIVGNTPSRRSVSSYMPKGTPNAPKTSSGAREQTPSKARPPATGNERSVIQYARGSKTLSARSSKCRPPLQNAFAKPLVVPNSAKAEGQTINPRVGLPSLNASAPYSPPSEVLFRSQAQTEKPSLPIDFSDPLKSLKSSAALRDTIAKAKAAQRRVSATQNKGLAGTKGKAEVVPDFNSHDIAGVLCKRVASARSDGRLNIAALGLAKIPREVMNIYSADGRDGAWYQSIDLIRLIAADNEIEQFEDEIFPDDAPRVHDMEDQYQGNIFGGLETLDLHGNHLKALPMGLRRLERLTTLNVSKNRLENRCISTISQIETLRELRLAENAINGALSSDLCSMKNLEVLDLNNNTISTLPNNIQELSNLRTVNIAGNRLESLPVECFNALPLVELDVSRNRLDGALFLPSVEGNTKLKYLDVANNALTSITTNASVQLPVLQVLNVTNNRLTALPDLSGWTALLTLTAGGNHLDSFPKGITALSQLRSVDFSRNDIKTLDERLGLMNNLTILRIANNPLRERKFLNMNTEEVKCELLSRLFSEEATNIKESNSDHTTKPMLNVEDKSSKIWPMNPDGTVDRSSTKLETIKAADLEPLVDSGNVTAVIVNRNHLQMIPQALTLLASTLAKLDLSHNKLIAAAYLPSTLSLPSLRSLDLSANAINSLSPIMSNLIAPSLAELNVSRNRLVSLSSLSNNFPSLKSLLASNNLINKLEVSDARGLHVLDISGNELSHLEPRLGLLGAEGLRTLIVGGNRFRVPRRDVVEKGTEATLTWLRNRIPDDDQ